MNEILNGIKVNYSFLFFLSLKIKNFKLILKVIKFYGWEVSFQKLVNKIRAMEMKYFVRNAYVGIVTSFTWACAPFMVAAVSFATFVLIDKNNVLDAGTAFVSLTVFYLIRFPLAMLPTTISMITQVKSNFCISLSS